MEISMKKILLCSLITLSVFAADGPDAQQPEAKNMRCPIQTSDLITVRFDDDDRELSFDRGILNTCETFRAMCQSLGHEDHKKIPTEILQGIAQHHMLKGLTLNQFKEFVHILNLESADEVHKYLAQYTIDLEGKDEWRKKQAQKILLALYQKADHMNVPLLQKICAKLIKNTRINVDHLPVQLSLPIMQPRINKALLSCIGYQQTVFNYDFEVISASFSPDGKGIVSASCDGTVRIWDAQNGIYLHTLSVHTGWVKSAEFSPDGKLIALVLCNGTVRIWDIRTGVCLHTLSGHTRWVRSASFSQDGKRIASTSEDKTVRIWDIQNGVFLLTLSGHTGWVNSISFSPDGKYIVSASDDCTIRIWDAQNGDCLHTLSGHTAGVNSVSFSPDGKYIVSASYDRTVRVWDIDTSTCLHTLQGHTDNVNSVAFSPDGKWIVSASDDGTVRIWDAQNGVCLHTLSGHTNCVRSASFSPDGKRIVSASDDKTVRIWQDYNRLLKKCSYEKELFIFIQLFNKARIFWQEKKPYPITVDEKDKIDEHTQSVLSKCNQDFIKEVLVKFLKDERLFIYYSSDKG
jgi:WD40 repeat protein